MGAGATDAAARAKARGTDPGEPEARGRRNGRRSGGRLLLALRIEYLTGRSVSTRYNDRSAAEWPPHPARVISALVATWADADPPSEAERAALEWLAAQPPPSISASGATERGVVAHYVPVNDTAVLKRFERQQSKLAQAHAALDGLASRMEALDSGERDTKAAATVGRERAKVLKDIDRQRAALRRLQADDQEPPATASKAAVAEARRLLPEHRTRQVRTFPSVTPSEPVVYMTWDAAPTPEHRSSLDGLARRVVRVGHSSSLVGCRFMEDAPPPTLVPREDGSEPMRVTAPGHIDRLRAAYDRHQGVEARVLPSASQWYGAPRAEATSTVDASVLGDEWIVLRQVGEPRLASTLAVEVSQAVRGALMSYGDQPPAEILTGHRPEGGPSETPHLAILPLPFVGHPRATGAILGVALVLPRAATQDQRRSVLRALGRWENEIRTELGEADMESPPLELLLGARGVVTVERIPPDTRALSNLRAATWTRPSRTWLSVTPVALDRNPGNLLARDATNARQAWDRAAETIASSCAYIGVPRPSRVELIPSVTMSGVSKARAFPPFPADARKTRRVKVHALLVFDEEVRGPIVLGAGRYYGLGLFRPVDGGPA
jgi:CRISPR-associated protein Csb2